MPALGAAAGQPSGSGRRERAGRNAHSAGGHSPRRSGALQRAAGGNLPGAWGVSSQRLEGACYTQEDGRWAHGSCDERRSVGGVQGGSGKADKVVDHVATAIVLVTLFGLGSAFLFAAVLLDKNVGLGTVAFFVTLLVVATCTIGGMLIRQMSLALGMQSKDKEAGSGSR